MFIGHERTIKDLKKLADSGLLAHGYLFYGPAMIGKRTLAGCLANYLEHGEFVAPKLLQDCVAVGPSDGTIGIDTVRELKNFLWQKPAISKYRTVIVDRAEAMTQEAQNALLRIAEEPPPSTLLILITSDSESILPTLLSRLHKVYFSLVDGKMIDDWIKKDFNIKGEKAEKIMKKSFGKPGLAHAFIHDVHLESYLKNAEQLLKAPQGRQRDLIKKLIEPEDFNLPIFLDTLALVLAGSERGKSFPSRWHRLLALRQRAANFPLNPRLQLENLLIRQ